MSKEELFERIWRYVDFKYKSRIILLALLQLDKELLGKLLREYLEIESDDDLITDFIEYCENNLSFEQDKIEDFCDKLYQDMVYSVENNRHENN